MEQWEILKGYLTQKKEILEKVTANTESQCRLIQKRHMKGLGRVLGEREVLLEELVVINKLLAAYQVGVKTPILVTMMQEIGQQEQKLLTRSRQVLQQAIAEQTLIATELKSSKVGRQVKSQYVNPWADLAQGRLINEKG